jgi:hypothetical protein
MKIINLSLSLLFGLSIGNNLVAQEFRIYSETFDACGLEGAREQTGWFGIVEGAELVTKTIGLPNPDNKYLEYTSEDHPGIGKEPVRNNPLGNTPGRVRWKSSTLVDKGLSIITDEVSTLNIPVDKISRVEFDQRWDSRDVFTAPPVSRVILRVNFAGSNFWYISSTAFPRPEALTSNKWEDDRSVNFTGELWRKVIQQDKNGFFLGPNYAAGADEALPTGAIVTAIGVFVSSNARFDLDNFVVYTTDGVTFPDAVTALPPLCQVAGIAVPTPRPTVSVTPTIPPIIGVTPTAPEVTPVPVTTIDGVVPTVQPTILVTIPGLVGTVVAVSAPQLCDVTVSNTPKRFRLNEKGQKKALKKNGGKSLTAIRNRLLISLITKEKINKSNLLVSLKRENVVVDTKGATELVLVNGKKVKLTKRTAKLLKQYINATNILPGLYPLFALLPEGSESLNVANQGSVGMCPSDITTAIK